MKLRKIEGAARGRDFDVTMADEVTVIAGPTGSCKTTLLNMITLALMGSVTGRGRAVKRPHEVFGEMGGSVDRPVGAIVHFDDDGRSFFVRRRLVGKNKNDKKTGETKLTVESSLDSSGLGTEDPVKAVGDVTALDVQGLLARSGPARRAAMIEMCRPFDRGRRGPEWCHEAFRRVVAESGTEIKVPLTWSGDATASTLEQLEATVTAAAAAVNKARERKDQAQRAVDGLAERAARDPSIPGSPEDLGRLIAGLDRDIEAAVRQLAEADERRGEILEAELARILAMPSLKDAQADLGRLIAELDAANKAKAAAQQQPAPPAPSSDLDDLERAGREARSALEEARREHAAAVAARDVVAKACSGLEGEANCPTCAQCITEEVVAALRGQIETLDAIVAEAIERVNARQTGVETLRSMYEAARTEDAESRAAHGQEMAQWRERATRLAAEVTRLGRELAAATAQVKASTEASERIAAIRAQLDAIQPVDTEMVTAELAGLRARKRELAAARDEAVAQREARGAMADAARDRDAAEASIEGLKIARDAWAEVLVSYTGDLFAPFTQAATTALPGGWAMDFDLASGAFLVSRPGLPRVDLTALSEGEQVLALAACAVGMARTGGTRWRVALVDHAEALSNWPTHEAPDGLFALFLAGLRKAVRAGMIDQAIVAYSRVPTDPEMSSADTVYYTAPVDPGPEDELAGVLRRLRAMDLPELRAVICQGYGKTRAPRSLDAALRMAEQLATTDIVPALAAVGAPAA